MSDKITIDRAVVERALKVLEYAANDVLTGRNAATELRAALEQPVEQEPVAWLWPSGGNKSNLTFGGPNSNTPKDWNVQPLFTHPQPPSHPLTEKEIDIMFDNAGISMEYLAERERKRHLEIYSFGVRDAEAKHSIVGA